MGIEPSATPTDTLSPIEPVPQAPPEPIDLVQPPRDETNTEVKSGETPPPPSPPRAEDEKEGNSQLEQAMNSSIPMSFNEPIFQFGYSIFNKKVSSFAPSSDFPVGPDYIVGPGDSFVISTWGKIDLRNEVTVDRAGTIFLPKVGSLSVWGMTVDQLTNRIKSELSKHYTGFDLSLNFTAIRTNTVYVMGEAKNPGVYQLSSLSTMFNALFETGGPRKSGSLREIELKRGGRTVGRLDVYDFLLKGSRSHDQKLLSGDILFIPPLKTVIGVVGHIQRPAIYEFKTPQVKLRDLLNLAGGIKRTGYLGRLQVVRTARHAHQAVLDVEYDEQAFLKVLDNQGKIIGKGVPELDFQLENQDLVKVFPILPGVRGIVTLSGHVVRPGDYQYRSGMRLRDLIPNTAALQAAPFLGYASISRLRPSSQEHEVISFSLADLLEGKEEANLALEEMDVVKIFSSEAMKPQWSVSVQGAVRTPGTFPYVENMRLKDLLYLAGNVLPTTYLDYAQLVRTSLDSQHDRELIPLRPRALLAGEESANLALSPKDVVIFFDMDAFREAATVSIEGPVRKPGSYRFVENLRLRDLLYLAGNTLPTIYLDYAQLVRTSLDSRHDQQLIPLRLRELLAGDESANIVLEPRDKVTLYDIDTFREYASVTIEGPVRKPGSYRYVENLRLRDLLYLAGNVLPSAYLDYAQLIRTSFEYRHDQELIPLRLRELLAGDESANLLLKPKDKVTLFDMENFREATPVLIHGRVARPGNFPWQKNMHLRDLVFLAGNVVRNAYLEQAEIIRWQPKQDGVQQSRLLLNLGKALAGDETHNLVLEPYDRVYVRTIPNWYEEMTITLNGEFRFPGEYSFSKGDRLAEVILRAGGFSEFAYLPAAVYTRESVRELQQKRLSEYSLRQQESLVREQTKLSEMVLNKEDLDIAQQNLAAKEAVLRRMLESRVTGRIILALCPLEEFKDSSHNLVVNLGDDLTLPRRPDYVAVIGEIFNPNAVIFEPGEDVTYYLDKVGGITDEADEGNLFIVRADGTVLSQRNNDGVIFGRFYNQELYPGDTILVPKDFSFLNTLTVVKDVSSILFQLATTAGVIFTVSGIR